MPTSRERMHLAYCPALGACVVAGGPGGKECEEFSDKLDQVVEDRAHRDAEYVLMRARKIEDDAAEKHGIVYDMFRHGARQLRQVAMGIDPYDYVPGTEILVRKSDGRYVRR